MPPPLSSDSGPPPPDNASTPEEDRGGFDLDVTLRARCLPRRGVNGRGCQIGSQVTRKGRSWHAFVVGLQHPGRFYNMIPSRKLRIKRPRLVRGLRNVSIALDSIILLSRPGRRGHDRANGGQVPVLPLGIVDGDRHVEKHQSIRSQAEIKQLLHLLSALRSTRAAEICPPGAGLERASDAARQDALHRPDRAESRRDRRGRAGDRRRRPQETTSSSSSATTGSGCRTKSWCRTWAPSRGAARSNSSSRPLSESRPTSKSADLSLIGQFGVGFYSAFMLADRVRVRTVGALQGRARGWEWESDLARGTFTRSRPSRARLPSAAPRSSCTSKDDAKEFADDFGGSRGSCGRY